MKFLEVDEEKTRLVLSNRKAIAENQAAFGIGSVVIGTVQTVKPYGAFIDIGGISGLLHISQISHDRLTTVETVLTPGDKLKVYISHRYSTSMLILYITLGKEQSNFTVTRSRWGLVTSIL